MRGTKILKTELLLRKTAGRKGIGTVRRVYWIKILKDNFCLKKS